MQLTSHERIMRIFQNKEVDRPALKLWGAQLFGTYRLRHPAYEPVAKLAGEISDLFAIWYPGINLYCGSNLNRYFETWTEKTADPAWNLVHSVYHTPKGDLHSVTQVSTNGGHDYTIEHFIKEPEDLVCLLSMEYAPKPIDRSSYDSLVKRVGDRGVVQMYFPHAGYALQTLMGSETLAYFSLDCREELLHALDVLADRLKQQVTAAFDTGITAPLYTYGPEVFIPPLMSPADFHDFVHKPDKPLYDIAHERGSYVWVHCHGKVANFIESYIDMGVDILNPLEPPKNGDIHMGDIIAKYGNRIGWEGNIEVQELIQSTPERVRELIDECVYYGNQSGRFVLCPSSGFDEEPVPSQSYIDNLMLYLNYGFEAVERCRK